MSSEPSFSNSSLYSPNSLVVKKQNYHSQYQVYLKLIESYEALLNQSPTSISKIEFHEEMILKRLPSFLKLQERYSSEIEVKSNICCKQKPLGNTANKKLMKNVGTARINQCQGEGARIDIFVDQADSLIPTPHYKSMKLTSNKVAKNNRCQNVSKTDDFAATSDSLSSTNISNTTTQSVENIDEVMVLKVENVENFPTETKVSRVAELMAQKEKAEKKAVERTVGKNICFNQQTQKSDGTSQSAVNKKTKNNKKKVGKKEQKKPNDEDDDFLNEAFNKAMEEEENYKKDKKETISARQQELLDNITEIIFTESTENFLKYLKDRRRNDKKDDLLEKIEILWQFYMNVCENIEKITYLDSLQTEDNYENIENEIVSLLETNKNVLNYEKKEKVSSLNEKVYKFLKNSSLSFYEMFYHAMKFLNRRIDALKSRDDSSSTVVVMKSVKMELIQLIKNNILCHLLFLYDTNLSQKHRDFEASCFFSF